MFCLKQLILKLNYLHLLKKNSANNYNKQVNE